MKKYKNMPRMLLFVILTFPMLSFSQNNINNELSFEVYKIYPPLSITKETLMEAQTLADLDHGYKGSWVKKYLSVELLTSHQGKILKVMGKDDTLNQAQKESLYTADVGTEIVAKVQYIPDNNLKYNDVQEMDFTLVISPEQDASYAGGLEALRNYLKENAIDKIPGGNFEGYNLAVIKFTIDEEGQIENPHIFESSKNEKIDQLLLTTIHNMHCWKPASYANGLKVKQEYALTIGNTESCIMNLINIRRDGRPFGAEGEE